ncbi:MULTISPECIES: radical SAM/SPASM domain-containing protein [unclassified Helicobacter]|uniref:radical SAM/SPASM domain-containing protein n=1 Tax=unclassified Helicobacter TaxID=2593540 RepID=UPI000CF09D0B|nr:MULTISPECIES: radical SAM/SPASM domain-containing protein [unclassified Helicobacter]
MYFKKIYIELSDICGLKCSFCPSQKGIRGEMSKELFIKIVDQIRGKCKYVCLHILGDPCRIKNLQEYLEILKNANLSVDLVTSGFYLKSKDFLIQPPIHQIAFSLDAGFDKNNKKHPDYLQKILDFCAFKMSYPSKVFINLRIQDTTLNLLPLQDIFKFFNKEIPRNLKAFERIKLEEYIFLNITKTFEWPSVKKEALQDYKVCHALKDQVGILSNGIVVPCCMDTQGDIALGSLWDDSLEEVLSTDRARKIKEGFRNHRAIEDLCKKCLFPTTRTLLN